MELRLNQLVKQYKDKTAVDHVTLTLNPGVWGLLGANGAGKTTLMRMAAGILTPDSGNVLYDGIDTQTLGAAYRDIFGYLPQSFGFYPEFNVIDYLQYISALKGLTKKMADKKIEELLHMLTLSDVKHKKIKKLSGGMQRRVGIAQAMLNEPDILILDEPTSGLDPGERVRFRKILSEFARERIVLISTHIVSDVEYIASQNAIMKDGKIIHHGATENLVATMAGKVWTCLISREQLDKYGQNLRIVNIKNEMDGRLALRYVALDCEVPNSLPAQPRLEDMYFWIFKEESPEMEGLS